MRKRSLMCMCVCGAVSTGRFRCRFPRKVYLELHGTAISCPPFEFMIASIASVIIVVVIINAIDVTAVHFVVPRNCQDTCKLFTSAIV